jgi:hypothetical protein
VRLEHLLLREYDDDRIQGNLRGVASVLFLNQSYCCRYHVIVKEHKFSTANPLHLGWPFFFDLWQASNI